MTSASISRLNTGTRFANLRFALAALSLAASLAACADESTLPLAPTRSPVPVGPSLTASVGYVWADPASISFAGTLYHMSRADTVTLTNSGKDTVAINGIAINGPNALDFNFYFPYGDARDCGSWIAPAASCLIGVQFTAMDIGQRVGSLGVSLPSGVLSVSLAGEGLQAALSYSPSTIAFADRTVGTTSAGQTVSIRNTGTADLQVWSMKLQGTNAADFLITQPSTNACVKLAAIAPNASCDIGVAFAPTASGTRSAQLTVETTNMLGYVIGTATVFLSGNAIDNSNPADLAVTFGTVVGQVQVGKTITYPITVRNTGPGVATGIGLSAAVPAGTGFAGLSVPTGVSCSAPAIGDAGGMNCSIGSMAPGTAYTVQLIVKTLSGNRLVIANTAKVASASPDPATGNNSATVSTTVVGRK